MSIIYHDIMCKLSPELKVLELGLGTSVQFARLPQKYKVSVDINNVQSVPTFHGTTDEFFKSNTEKFDSILIDADHSYLAVAKDFNNSLRNLTETGLIFLHDLLPVDEKHTNPESSGDGFIVLNYFLENGYNFVVCEEDHSLTTIFPEEKPIDLSQLDRYKMNYSSFKEKMLKSSKMSSPQEILQLTKFHFS